MSSNPANNPSRCLRSWACGNPSCQTSGWYQALQPLSLQAQCLEGQHLNWPSTSLLSPRCQGRCWLSLSMMSFWTVHTRSCKETSLNKPVSKAGRLRAARKAVLKAFHSACGRQQEYQHWHPTLHQPYSMPSCTREA